jgi:hypothetical protein
LCAREVPRRGQPRGEVGAPHVLEARLRDGHVVGVDMHKQGP